MYIKEEIPKAHKNILVNAMVDPFRDCKMLFDEHFSDRMQQRSLPPTQVEIALKDGKRIQQRKGVYLVKWKKWTLSVVVFPCTLMLNTAYRE